MPTVSPHAPREDSTDLSPSEVTLISPSFEVRRDARWRWKVLAALLSGMLAGLLLGLIVFGVFR